ncbi:sirohydrochlorin cobaltochelatase [Fusobacterium gastrosuis]|uniref:sirohydrochlorin cobaltochelatase n=1 Tax=Fusobacterium gastrosuis TaxID=1755100 RepID=UPI002975C2FC|nr:sirohydrochlorin cobaltochelatase [Fusobacteriaceae bacterium]MDY5305072.1 sirohydrochlorin cobaltochelatase [Fusobacterium gastrosuis]MDY5712892.1 sirohydrochlorin cobaltochelatase [Fusobacterium gastrosuis]
MKNKNALFMIHFGTTHDDTRELTINRMNEKFSENFKDYDLFEAYTSRIVLKKLRDRNIFKNHPLKVLEMLEKQGYENIIVQSSHIIPGIEYENLLEELSAYKNKFKSIKIGKPLLYNVIDYKKVVEAIQEEYVPKNKKEALVLVCHGTDSPVGAAYALIEYVFDEYGHENVYVVSTKEYPLMETLIKKLKKDGIEEVVMAPFMFVAGEHAKNDMAGDFKEELEENGFKVNKVFLKGLGEFEEIQNIYLEHLKKAIEKDEENIADFKKEFAAKYL